MTSLEGDLQRVRLPKVLLAVASQQGNGILTVQGAEDIVAVSFVQGAIVTADALNQTVEEGLGKVLQSRGLVSPENFNAAVRDYQGGATGSLGELLVERGLIGRPDLLEALRIQTFRSMLQLLTWQSGDFKFYSGDEVSYEEGFVPIRVDELLLQAIDSLGEKAGLVGTQPDLGTIYRPVPPRGAIQVMGRDGDGLAAGIWITPVHSTLLGAIDGQRPAGEIAKELGLDRYQAAYGLYRLLEHDLIEGSGRSAGAVPAFDSGNLSGTGIASPVVANAGMGGSAVGGPGPGSPAQGFPVDAIETPAVRPTAQPSGTIPFADELQGAAGPGPGMVPGSGPVPAVGPGTGAPRVPAGPSPATQGRAPARAAAEPDSRPARPAPATGAWLLDWGGLGLAVLLLLAIGLTVLSRPVALLLPFSWQENSRSTMERQVRESLFQRIDRSARTYFLMEAHYPDTLEELRGRGMISGVDLQDPAGYDLDYSPESVSYRIQLQDDGQAVEGLGNTEAITGDFLVDPQFLKAAASAEAPLVLLD